MITLSDYLITKCDFPNHGCANEIILLYRFLGSYHRIQIPNDTNSVIDWQNGIELAEGKCSTNVLSFFSIPPYF